MLKRLVMGTLMVVSLLAWVAAPVYAQSIDRASVVTSRRDVTPANSPSAGVMAVDAILVRPLGLAATVVGAGLFVVSLPFSAIGGNVGEAGSTLVAAPAKMTFDRPLGDFSNQ